MVAQEAALRSSNTAQQVADSLVTFHNDHPNEHFALFLVEIDENGKESPYGVINIRPVSKTPLADGTEILHCITDDDKRVSIEVGHKDHRPEHARVRVEP